MEYLSRGFTGLLLFTQIGTTLSAMAERQFFPPPEPLQLSIGNSSQNWKRFKQKWSNYELATGVANKDDAIRVATNTFTWDDDEDKVKIDKVLEQFEKFCEPRKNTIYERYLFFSRGQESGESIDKYATVLRNMADNCEFQDLKDSLIRDRIVLGVSDNHVRERLLRVPDLTLEKALEISRAAEATQSQLKQMQNIQEVNELRSKNERTPNEKFEGKTPAYGGEHIDCKFCGRRHVRDRMKCPAYGQRCNRCGKNDHFAVKCLAGKRLSEKSRADQKLHYVDNFDQCPFEEYTIDAVTHSAVENTKYYPKQLFTTVRVNNSKDVTFQLDCGATCNLLPLKELSSILEDLTDLYLKKTSATLNTHSTLNTHYPLPTIEDVATRL